MIPLKVHNVLDYVIGVALALSPYVFGFSDVTAARNVFLVLGIGLIAYSSITNYYYSVAKIIPLGVHMVLDALAGIVLILSPALFGYRDLITDGQFALHFVMGIGTLGLVALTRTRTEEAKTPVQRMEIRHHEMPLTR
jgi:hypothetical protein